MAQLKQSMFREYDLRGEVNDEQLNEYSVGIIAQAYGTTVADLMDRNGLTDPNWITAGQVLRLPNPAPHSDGVKATPGPSTCCAISSSAAFIRVSPRPLPLTPDSLSMAMARLSDTD